MHDQTCLTVDEVAERVHSLGKVDRLRLGQLALVHSLGCTPWEPRDLLHEAILRAMSGERRCPTTMAIVPFLDGVMSSIADAIRRRRALGVVTPVNELPPAADDEQDPYLNRSSGEMPPDDAMIAAQERAEMRAVLDAIYETFKDDQEVTAVLMGIDEEWSAEQVRQTFDMSETAYASARKRLRRELNRRWPKGMAQW